MENNIRIKRVAGTETTCRVKFELEFDATDNEAANRLGRILRELIPEEDRSQFVADFNKAAAKAGF